jgi:C-terminal processing protease CtpA/Prc
MDTAAYAYTPPRVLLRPSAVAVLVDSICASSCEDFVAAARQSGKVTVFSATNTAGAGDYGNIRPVMLPGWRRLRVATSRSRRLRAGMQAATDYVGLAPDVRVPRDSAVGHAAVKFALHHLHELER